MTINPAAYFDSLGICLRLQKRLNEPSVLEICMFSYLSCLLWLYKGQPIALWGYSFSVTKQAFVFSPDIQEVINVLEDMGFIQKREALYISVTALGEEEYENLKMMSNFAEREPYLDGACSSLLALPFGTIREALQQEPDISSSIALSQSRNLFTDNDLDSLYAHFEILSKVIDINIKELMIPATIWLKYLAEIKNGREH